MIKRSLAIGALYGIVITIEVAVMATGVFSLKQSIVLGLLLWMVMLLAVSFAHAIIPARSQWYHFTDHEGDCMSIAKDKVFALRGEIQYADHGDHANGDDETHAYPHAPYILYVHSDAIHVVRARLTLERAKEVEAQVGFVIWEDKDSNV